MFKTGLVSISFRSLSVSEIAELMQSCDLQFIEWGSDVHAPCDAPERLHEIVELQKKFNLSCSSYGTYFKLGIHDPGELIPYIRAAGQLGTNILRIWCGQKNFDLYTPSERQKLLNDAKESAKIAEDAGVILCAECHPNTITNCLEGAEELLAYTCSPAFRMYWQPNQFQSVETNCRYALSIAPFVENIHVFQWKERERFPLAQGLEEWGTYLSYFDASQTLLLEFMPDNLPASLQEETTSLCKIVKSLPRKENQE